MSPRCVAAAKSIALLAVAAATTDPVTCAAALYRFLRVLGAHWENPHARQP
ncbi:MAG TPA: hypothetical protein VG184_02720 [Acidimicrobiales bacterium]|nr:hypothetical protein [Acidimicrobiales bacterium]